MGEMTQFLALAERFWEGWCMKIFYRAALVADALSLGPHWVYDQEKLASAYPEGVKVFTDPLSAYHPNRKAGEFTHFGDQAVLLEKIDREEGWF